MAKLRTISTSALIAVVGAGCNDPISGYFAKNPSVAKSDSQSGPVLPNPGKPGGTGSGGNSVPVPVPTYAVPPTVESFSLSQTVNKTVQRYKGVDMLWVIDNSGSMDPYQKLIAAGFKSFAETFFVAGRDIRLATITSDTFIAGDAPATAADAFGPMGGACYSLLIPGTHDGVRPNVAPLNNDCSLKGALPAGRTGEPILSTYSASGALANLNQVIANFQVNAKPGISGSGDERMLQSMNKLLKDNEERPECVNGTGVNCLFRKNRIRSLIFISDEHSHDVISFGNQSADATNATIGTMTDNQVVANAQKLAGVFKARVNDFFSKLDGRADPNYFVTSIANHVCTGDRCGLNSKGVRNADEPWTPELTAVADAVYSDTANSIGKLSLKSNINDSDYSQILSKIGTAIETQTEVIVVSTFDLKAAPSSSLPLKAVLVLVDGTRTQLPLAAVKVTGRTVEIDKSALPSSPPAGAVIEISYYQ